MKQGMKSIRDELTECFSSMQNESEKQADLVLEIEASKGREEKFQKRAFVLSANYYTRERIEQIANESIEILKKHDIDVERLNKVFSDVDNISIDLIELLYDREVEIAEMKTILESNAIATDRKNSKIQQKLLAVANEYYGGGRNER